MKLLLLKNQKSTLIEFLCLRVLFENSELFYFQFMFSYFLYFSSEFYKSMMTVLLYECQESLKSNREAYDIFYVNFITLSYFTIHGAYAFPYIPKIVNVLSKFQSKVGNIYGGYTLGNGIQILTLILTFFYLILICNEGRNCESLFLFGRTSSLSIRNY